MDKELVIDVKSTEVNIALLENEQLVEFIKEENSNFYNVGDVYWGKVKKIMPGLNAAFIDIGHKKDAFLHYLDLGRKIKSLNKYTKLVSEGKNFRALLNNFSFEKDIEKTGKIGDVLTSGQKILVQIVKEPISTKGPRVTSEISFAGRFVVLIPFSNRISISQKIKSLEERNRLRRLMKSIKPKNFGVIIRTASENRKVAELDTELRNLVEKWKSTPKKLKNAKPPQRIISELDRTQAFLRDMLNDSFTSIHINDQSLFKDTKDYIELISKGKEDIVKFYKGKKLIFDQYGIDRKIKKSFGKIVTRSSGVYLIIEHTEALHVIDVNSGHRVNKEKTQEENALSVNLEAAKEVARQLRLRDMGGIIVIDFIDMTESKNRRALYQKLKDEMKKNSARHAILSPSKFGLVQITRQRVRPEMNIEVQEKCPVCHGSGKAKSSILLVDEIENHIRYLFHEQNEKKLKLIVHPFVYTFLKRGIFSEQTKWFLNFGKWVSIKQDNNYHYLEYRFLNSFGDEIKL